MSESRGQMLAEANSELHVAKEGLEQSRTWKREAERAYDDAMGRWVKARLRRDAILTGLHRAPSTHRAASEPPGEEGK